MFHELTMGPGSLKEASFRLALDVPTPRFRLEERVGMQQRATQLKSLLVISVRIGGEEQLIPATEGRSVPAELFGGLTIPVIFPGLRAGTEFVVGFANPLGSPTVSFRVWFSGSLL